jgi:hypothetical protein
VSTPVHLIAEQKVAQHFRDRGATSVADAIGYDPELPLDQRAFKRLEKQKILKSDGQGKWWLDEDHRPVRRSDRRKGVLLTVLAAGAAAAYVALS